MRRLAVLWVVACWALASPAVAHDRATARIDSPAPGAVVAGREVEVLLSAGRGAAPAEFRLLLDGSPVDETGAVGSGALFTTFRLPPSTSKRLVVPLASPGGHTLRLEPTPHADRPENAVVTTFTSTAPTAGEATSGAPATPPVVPDSGGRGVLGKAGVVLAATALGCGLVFLGKRWRQPAP